MDIKHLPDKLQINLLELKIEELNAIHDVSSQYSSYAMISAEKDRIRKGYEQLRLKMIEDFNNA